MLPAPSGHGISGDDGAQTRPDQHQGLWTFGRAASGKKDPARADAAIRSLARLIGRQIAREQFERNIARERKAQKKRPAGEDA